MTGDSKGHVRLERSHDDRVGSDARTNVWMEASDLTRIAALECDASAVGLVRDLVHRDHGSEGVGCALDNAHPLRVDGQSHVVCFRPPNELLLLALQVNVKERGGVVRPLVAVLQKQPMQDVNFRVVGVYAVSRVDATLPLGCLELVVKQMLGHKR
jgi:hypothetical protein